MGAAVVDPARALPMTDVADGLTHALTDEAFAAGHGWYTAICDAEVCPTAATAPLGPACPECVRIMRQGREPVYVQVPAPRRGRPRHRRPGRLQLVLGHVSRGRR